MTLPSFERFDYLLRTNKHIERKLVFDVLSAAARSTDFSKYWYLGFGSMWFGDFRLAHRLLGIDVMISIERSDYAPRAMFNRPFAGVTVEPGECGDVLKRLQPSTWEKPLVAWLDYDGHLNSDIVVDIDRILSMAQPDSVVAVTVNAARNTYRVRGQGGPKSRSDLGVGVVESFLGPACIAARFQPTVTGAGAQQEISEKIFPEFLIDAIMTYMSHKIVSLARVANGERLTFVPLFRLHHRDGADMVTVGGAITRESGAAAWETALARQPTVTDGTGQAAYTALDLIPITVKEKIALDACLPSSAENEGYMEAAKEAGLKLDDEDIRKYERFYRHFPVFVETSM